MFPRMNTPTGITYCLIFLISAVISYFISLNGEDLLHYNCLNFWESWHVAKCSYLHWNPRIGELLAFFLGHNVQTWVFFINTLITFSCILFIYRIGTGKWPGSDIRSAVSLLFCLITVLGFSTGITWFLGNMSWLYPCTLTLILFYLTEPFFKGNFHLSWRKTVLAIPIAFITGMSNNNTAIVAWLIMAGCGAFWSIATKQNKLTPQYAVILATLTISCTLFYMAPGTYERAQKSNWELSFSNLLWNSILAPTNWIFFVIMFWRMILSMGSLVVLQRISHCCISRSRLLIFSISFFCLWGVLLATPLWGAPRSYLPLKIVLACIMVHIFYRYTLQASMRKIILLFIFHCCVMSTQIIPVCQQLIISQREWKRIVVMAEKAKEQGNDFVIVKANELDFSSGLPHIWKLPASVFNYKITPTIPLIRTSEEMTQTLNHRHKYIESIRTLDSGDHIMNPIAAKKLGLKAVFYLPTE